MKTKKSTSAPEVNRPSIFNRLGMGAFTISLLVHGIFILVAAVFLYKWIYPPPEENIFRTPGGERGKAGETIARIKSQKYQTVAPVNMRKIVFAGPSDVTLPETSANLTDSALPQMMGGLGAGGLAGAPGGHIPGANGPAVNGPGMGPGPGLGLVTPFGGNIAAVGTLPGRFYDFKQTKEGRPTPGYSISNKEDYVTRILKIQDSGFRENAFRKFFEAPDSLYLTQLAIPTSDANSAPTFFNVADKVKPSGWLVVYNGQISPERDMTFRFVGTGDDYISVFGNRRAKMINAWPDMRPYILDRWKPAEPIDEAAPSPLPGGPLVKGDWITLRKGEKLDLSISVGERPGGKVGFVLMVEEKGANYRTASNGAQVLPLFTTQPISQSSRDRITKDFPKWEFEWENVPVFRVDKTSGMGADFR